MSSNGDLYRAQVDSFMMLCFRKSSLTPAERTVWLTLHHHVFDNGGVPVSLTSEQLMLRTGIRSRTTLRKALRGLKESGLICVEKAKGRHSATYRVEDITEEMIYGKEPAPAEEMPAEPEPVFTAPAADEPVLTRSQSRQSYKTVFGDVCVEIKDFYNSNRNRMREIRSLDGKRKKLLKTTLNDYSVEEIKEAILKASGSKWLNGQATQKNGRPVNWRADFEWLLHNVGRILEGSFDNPEEGAAPSVLDRVAAGLFGELLESDTPVLPGGVL